MDAGQQVELQLASIDLLQLAGRLIAEHSAQAERHTLALDSELDGLRVEADELRLERVLSNLLSNAVKYSPPGSEVRVAVGREHLDDRDWATLTGRDSGVGIPANQLERVFERFQRGDNVRERIGGTGIGLTYVREVVLLHGGTISVESQENAGSAFTVRLPLP
jgi:signal transduction histidine kinase